MNMRNVAWAMIVAVLIPCHEADGRGGGGRGGGGFHGGGGGGGGFHGGARPSINRTPSFSAPRPQARPASSGISHLNRPSGGNRPQVANRPAGGERPNIGNRPNVGNQPSIGSRPNIGSRPSIGDRPAVGDRPNIANRPGGGDRPNRIDGNRPDFANRPQGDNNFNFNQFNSYGHNHINHNDWHHGNWHDHWDRPWTSHPWAWWGAGVSTGVVASAIPWSWGYWSYSNPYATAPVVIDNSSIDYSQPILAADSPTTTAAGDGSPEAPAPADLAAADFDRAREAFLAQDYQTALAQVNQAIAKVPNDTSLHEFRGLVLFALKQYKDAAAAVYAVLSAGPGWDWTTLSGLYPSVDVYTQQLRALEAYRKQHPDEPQAHFLLAYHYLTCGKTDAAATELKAVVRLNPQDQLAAQLLGGITGPPEPAVPPKPDEPSSPAKPVSAASLAGSWTSSRPDGSAIALDLGKDSKYTWKFTQQGKDHDFGGTYTVADNLLILNQDNNPAMVGQVTHFEGKGFNFRLPGSPSDDPGLAFAR